jgi:hypothetical protein
MSGEHPRRLATRHAFSQTAAAVVFATVFASFIGLSHAHARSAGWATPERPCTTCLFQLHAPHGLATPHSVVQHRASRLTEAPSPLPARSFSAPHVSQGRAPPTQANRLDS